MLKLMGVLVIILLPLLLIGLAWGRKMEAEQDRRDRDRAIREGINALGSRIRNLEALRRPREERRR